MLPWSHWLRYWAIHAGLLALGIAVIHCILGGLALDTAIAVALGTPTLLTALSVLADRRRIARNGEPWSRMDSLVYYVILLETAFSLWLAITGAGAWRLVGGVGVAMSLPLIWAARQGRLRGMVRE